MAFRKAKAVGEQGTENRLHRSISCFAFNSDKTQIALSPNDSTIQIFKLPSIQSSSDKWTLEHELEGHDSFVSGIDWSPVTNFIVSSGHDRNAYVWKYDENDKKWIPTLVILRINRAANCVRWSLDGNKFAVGSSAKQVPVCHYEQGNNWWVSKMLKQHKSTVLTVSWHPNNRFLLTGGCDYKCRIFSAFIPAIDNKDGEEDFNHVFKNQFSFGSLLAEFDGSKGWVESVCWSPNGLFGAFSGHDSTLNFFRILNTGPKSIETSSVRLNNLPFRSVAFISNETIIASGYDCNIFLYRNTENGDPDKWEFKDKMDKEGKAKNTAKQPVKKSAFAASKALFQTTTTKGVTSSDSPLAATILKTRHQNQIIELFPLFSNPEAQSCSQFYSCGIDGRLLFWDAKESGLV